jgi:hypothetical protein
MINGLTGQDYLNFYYAYNLVQYAENVFYLLPVIANTLLAIDRGRTVTSPVKWFKEYGTSVYARKLICKVVALSCIPGIIFAIVSYVTTTIIWSYRVELNITNTKSSVSNFKEY